MFLNISQSSVANENIPCPNTMIQVFRVKDEEKLTQDCRTATDLALSMT